MTTFPENDTAMTKPFLRWAGGKRWLSKDLCPLISELLSRTQGRYVEPFLGSGAIFFGVSPNSALLSDLNQELIDAYRWVRDNPTLMEQTIKSWPVEKEEYYRIRSNHFMGGAQAAARFIYLNRTCYGGIHRTNRKGEFNTPFGGGSRTPDTLWKDSILSKCSEALTKTVSLKCSDFEKIIDSTTSGDIVFCDPTYSDVTKQHFDRYGSIVFDWNDQIRLANAVKRAHSRGVICIICNGAFNSIAKLYKQAHLIKKCKKKSIGRARINGTDEEYIFISDPYCRKEFWSRLGDISNPIPTGLSVDRIAQISTA